MGLVANSQVLRPSTAPITNSTGRIEYGYLQADSGYIWSTARDTFPARYKTTIWHTDGNFYKTPGGVGSYWTLWIPKVAATVSEVNTNASTGITGGPITTTGTISADTSILTTRARTKQQTDSVIGLISGGGFGTVLNVSVVNANGITATVVNPTSTPAITLKLFGITPTSVNTSGVITATRFSGDGSTLSGVLKNGDSTSMLNGYVRTVGVVSANGITGISSGGQNPLLTIGTPGLFKYDDTTALLSTQTLDRVLATGNASTRQATVGILTASNYVQADSIQSGTNLGINGTLTLDNQKPLMLRKVGGGVAINAISMSASDSLLLNISANPLLITGNVIKFNTNGSRQELPTNKSGIIALTSDVPSGALTSAQAGTGISIATSGGVFTVTNTSPSSGGTVTLFSSTASSGIIDVVINSTTTPTQILSLGNITPTSVNSSGAITATTLAAINSITGGSLNITGSGTFSGAVTAGNTFRSTGFIATPTSWVNDAGMAINSTATTANYFIGHLANISGFVINNKLTGVNNLFIDSTTGNITVSGSLTVTNNSTIGGDLTVTNITASGAITGANGISGLLTTVAQTNITMVGTLSALTVAGNVNSTTLNVSSVAKVGSLTTLGGISTASTSYARKMVSNFGSSTDTASIVSTSDGQSIVVGDDGRAAGFEATTYGNFPFISFRRFGNTFASKTATGQNQTIGIINNYAYNGSSALINNASLSFQSGTTTGTWTTGSTPTEIALSVTDSGATTRLAKLRIKPNGDVLINTIAQDFRNKMRVGGGIRGDSLWIDNGATLGGGLTITGNLKLNAQAGTAGVDSILVSHNGVVMAISAAYYGAGGGGITGSGTANLLTKWTATSVIGTSILADNGTTLQSGAAPSLGSRMELGAPTGSAVATLILTQTSASNQYAFRSLDNNTGQFTSNLTASGTFTSTGNISITGIVSGGGVSTTGGATIGSLVGTGSRAVLADATGVLSAPVSDSSVKEKIRPIKYGIETIMKLTPVWGEYKKGWKNYGEGRQNFLIAQNVQKYIPEAVFLTPSTGKLGINKDQLDAVYVQALQDLQHEIEELRLEIKKLKKRK